MGTAQPLPFTSERPSVRPLPGAKLDLAAGQPPAKASVPEATPAPLPVPAEKPAGEPAAE